MSGVYIKGMEMPKKIEPGLVIEFADGIDGKRYARLHHYRYGGLTDWLEAVPVPPHGRLIEDVAVREQIDEWLDSVGDVVVGRGLSYYGELLGCIEDAPTIIPAEEGE